MQCWRHCHLWASFREWTFPEKSCRTRTWQQEGTVTGHLSISCTCDSGMINLSRKWRILCSESQRPWHPERIGGQPKDREGGVSIRVPMLTPDWEHHLLWWPSPLPWPGITPRCPVLSEWMLKAKSQERWSCRPWRTWRTHRFGSKHHNYTTVLLTLPQLHICCSYPLPSL